MKESPHETLEYAVEETSGTFWHQVVLTKFRAFPCSLLKGLQHIPFEHQPPERQHPVTPFPPKVPPPTPASRAIHQGQSLAAGLAIARCCSRSWISLNSTSNYLYYPGEERRALYISTWQSIAAKLGDIILDLTIICNLCFKQKLPNTRPKLVSSLLQPLPTAAGFSFPGDKGCVCTAIRGWALIVFPPQPLLQDHIAPSLKEIRERRKREFQLKEVLFF